MKNTTTAWQYLVERLHEGRTVGGLTLRDLIDSDLNGPRCEFATIEVTNLMLAESGARAALADRYVEGVIERYLTTKPELVMETAAELEADTAVDLAIDRYREREDA